eukprot:2291120-Lingulodinium_polyedra.AAC.1
MPAATATVQDPRLARCHTRARRRSASACGGTTCRKSAVAKRRQRVPAPNRTPPAERLPRTSERTP